MLHLKMYETIKNFNQQFAYQPVIENKERLKTSFSKFIIGGMGGSNLVAELLQIRDPYLKIFSHRDYGLPKFNDLKDYLLIANSYSGNTEETIDFLLQAIEKDLNIAVVSTNGKLIEIAQKYHLPYIQMPKTSIQPRLALGFNIKAIVKLIGKEDWLEELSALKDLLKPAEPEEQGKELAQRIFGYIPIIYASTQNRGIAYNWKIKFNETGKIPAFYNVLPELNHNEMTGFDLREENKKLLEKFYFLFLKDKDDHPRIQKRMEVLKRIYQQKGFKVEVLDLEGKTIFQKIFNSLILADWTSYYTALKYNVDPEEVPLVEEFKKLIKEENDKNH